MPAVRGIQAKKEYYTMMMPLRMLKQNLFSETEDMPPAMRAQRMPKPKKVKDIAAYVTGRQDSYVLPSVTCSVNVSDADQGSFQFEPVKDDCDIGSLHIPMSGTFMVNDGQHRLAGLLKAMEDCPDLGDETIPVTVFAYLGLKRSQQMFHDLNYYASKPPSSLNLLYDFYEEESAIARGLLKAVPLFGKFTDCERTSVGKRSSKLFTLNGVHAAVCIMRKGLGDDECDLATLVEYWTEVAAQMPDWMEVDDRHVSAGEVRSEQVSGHAVTLEALAHVGVEVMARDLEKYPNTTWRQRLYALTLPKVNWRKDNADWEGVFMYGGTIRKNKTTAQAFAKYLLERESK